LGLFGGQFGDSLATFYGRQRDTMTTTATATAAIPKFRYLSAWFCPFAHRATIALEHHAGRVEYEWVEALGWEQRKDAQNVTGTGKEMVVSLEGR
jgi:hypothetical protein